MASSARCVLAVSALFLGAITLNAQAALHPGSTQITLGQSVVPLNGPWKFTVGDSPIDPKTGQPVWAEPGFDDSKWETVDLTPKQGPLDLYLDPNTVPPDDKPGWTAKTHPGYSGYAWYRIRVEVQPPQSGSLAISGPDIVDDAYQVFDNGKLAGQFGFTGGRPGLYVTLPKTFLLSGNAHQESAATTSDRTGPAGASRVLAFRVWMDHSTLDPEQSAGGMRLAPVLGGAGAVEARTQVLWLRVIRTWALFAVEVPLFLLLSVFAFTLILFDRSDSVYLWMGLLFLVIAVDSAMTVDEYYTQLLSYPVDELLLGVLDAFVWGAWVMVWWIWFGRQRPSWLPGLNAALVTVLMVAECLFSNYFSGSIPEAMNAFTRYTVSFVQNLFFAITLWIVIQGIRRQGVEGWLVLPVVLVNGIYSLPPQLRRLLHIPRDLNLWGVDASVGALGSYLVAAVIVLLLLRRLLQSVKRQRQMALDVKHAQEVQQVILPDARLALPGLSIESEYRPAQEVGGDFFQIVPHPTDGSALIVAGDVAGKGLQAGMLVALLIGAIRATARSSFNPVEMLAELNQSLLGRKNAMATCLALHIAGSGAATLANAGHIAPYRNGSPLPMEGALPLGLIERAEPSVMHFQLNEGDRLMLMSDGVAEATDTKGELFGFDRVQALLRNATTAAEVARAAQKFGQQDDISVITVTKAAVQEMAARHAFI
jgi:hypothetical protein